MTTALLSSSSSSLNFRLLTSHVDQSAVVVVDDYCSASSSGSLNFHLLSHVSIVPRKPSYRSLEFRPGDQLVPSLQPIVELPLETLFCFLTLHSYLQFRLIMMVRETCVRLLVITWSLTCAFLCRAQGEQITDVGVGTIAALGYNITGTFRPTTC